MTEYNLVSIWTNATVSEYTLMPSSEDERDKKKSLVIEHVHYYGKFGKIANSFSFLRKRHVVFFNLNFDSDIRIYGIEYISKRKRKKIIIQKIVEITSVIVKYSIFVTICLIKKKQPLTANSRDERITYCLDVH